MIHISQMHRGLCHRLIGQFKDMNDMSTTIETQALTDTFHTRRWGHVQK
jgi:hypothetical protein